MEYVCMYVSYVYMYVCMSGCLAVCMYACMHACIHVYMYECMHACMCACKYVCDLDESVSSHWTLIKPHSVNLREIETALHTRDNDSWCSQSYRRMNL